VLWPRRQRPDYGNQRPPSLLALRQDIHIHRVLWRDRRSLFGDRLVKLLLTASNMSSPPPGYRDASSPRPTLLLELLQDQPRRLLHLRSHLWFVDARSVNQWRTAKTKRLFRRQTPWWNFLSQKYKNQLRSLRAGMDWIPQRLSSALNQSGQTPYRFEASRASRRSISSTEPAIRPRETRKCLVMALLSPQQDQQAQ
jgi:hypothetical protein